MLSGRWNPTVLRLASTPAAVNGPPIASRDASIDILSRFGVRVGRSTRRRRPLASSTAQRIFGPRDVCCAVHCPASQCNAKSTPPAPASSTSTPDATISPPRPAKGALALTTAERNSDPFGLPEVELFERSRARCRMSVAAATGGPSGSTVTSPSTHSLAMAWPDAVDASGAKQSSGYWPGAAVGKMNMSHEYKVEPFGIGSRFEKLRMIAFTPLQLTPGMQLSGRNPKKEPGRLMPGSGVQLLNTIGAAASKTSSFAVAATSSLVSSPTAMLTTCPTTPVASPATIFVPGVGVGVPPLTFTKPSMPSAGLGRPPGVLAPSLLLSRTNVPPAAPGAMSTVQV